MQRGIDNASASASSGSRPIVLYCPDLPPVPGGVSDHTPPLAAALARRVPVHLMALRGDPASAGGVPCTVGVGVAAVPEAAADLRAGGVVFQYVPFLYARRGVAPGLVLAARRLNRLRIPVALVLHEPFVPFTRLPWLVTGVFQRLQLRALAGASRLVVTPVPQFASIARRYGATQTAVAPVGSVFQPVRAARDEVRARLAIGAGDVAIGVFSPGASGYLRSWIHDAVRLLAGDSRIIWVLMGFGSGALASAMPPGRSMLLGERSLAELSQVMYGLDLFAAPYEDGLTLRRTGAMFGLAHGLPVVSSRGHLFDESLADVAACARDSGEFAASIRALAGDAAARAALAARAAAARDLTTQEKMAGIIVEAFAR